MRVIIVTQMAASSLLHTIWPFRPQTIRSEHGQVAQSTLAVVLDDFFPERVRRDLTHSDGSVFDFFFLIVRTVASWYLKMSPCSLVWHTVLTTPHVADEKSTG